MTSPTFNRKVRRAKRIAKPGGSMLEAEIHAEVVRRLRETNARVLVDTTASVPPHSDRPDVPCEEYGGIRFFHCPNESKAAPQYRAKLKRLGVSPGVPDIIIVTPPPCGGYVAAALEIKRRGGRLSETQRGWLNTMASCGWAVACEYGLDACLNQLREWGYLQ